MDNLIHPAGYQTAPPNSLGNWIKRGQGPGTMLLIAGAGFDATIFEQFMEERADDYTMYAVTLAGFGGTQAPPMPPEGTSYAEQSWTTSAVNGVRALISDEGLHDIVVVGHWLTGTQVALRLALDNPELVKSVIILSGSARWVPGDSTRLSTPIGVEQRVSMVDTMLATRWFKTVTRTTWDDNNFLPQDYSRLPLRSTQLWLMAYQPTLPTWIRYSCEYFAQDMTPELSNLTEPTLIVMPGFDDDCYVPKPGNQYMRALSQWCWIGVEDLNPKIRTATIHGSRLFTQDDQPEELNKVVSEFLHSL